MGALGRAAAMTAVLVAVGVALIVNPQPTGLEAVDSAAAKARATEAGQAVAAAWEQYSPAARALVQELAGLQEELGRSVAGLYGAAAVPRRGPHSSEQQAGAAPPAAQEDCTCEGSESSSTAACAVHGLSERLQEPAAEERRLDECCCAPATIEALNAAEVYPALDELIQKPFFRYFKINLYTPCPLWPDDGLCMMETCAVAECEDGEIPLPWKLAEAGELDLDHVCTVDKGRQDGSRSEQPVDTTMDAGVRLRLSHLPDWTGVSNPWMVEEKDGEFVYVDLQRNPEKNTGYKGEHARKVWAAIYGQKCFEDIDSPDTCQEDKVFYKLISGVHTSITTHTMPSHLIKHRLGADWAKPFVDNLFFSYLFVLRAVMKAGPLLEEMAYSTGNPADDNVTQRLMKDLVGSQSLQDACPVPFDEGRMWRGSDSELKREELRLQLHNVTRVMDCVGCDKCKMWAKLRMLGIAAAFKILFSVESCAVGQPRQPQPELVLERNEVIALINLLAQFSSSIEAVRTMHDIPDPPPEPADGPTTPF